ncbi:MAG: hypothetical protein OEW98_00190 [Betaproteobacteria bacterium]|nr:hypothetical protein [Betaproteobacteria bacterium]
MTKAVSHTRPAMSPAGRELWEMGQALVAAAAQRSRVAHTHWCGCGDFLVCHQEPDRCVVPQDWTCPACEREQQDQWVDGLEGGR